MSTFQAMSPPKSPTLLSRLRKKFNFNKTSITQHFSRLSIQSNIPSNENQAQNKNHHSNQNQSSNHNQSSNQNVPSTQSQSCSSRTHAPLNEQTVPNSPNQDPNVYGDFPESDDEQANQNQPLIFDYDLNTIILKFNQRINTYPFLFVRFVIVLSTTTTNLLDSTLFKQISLKN